MNDPVEVPPCSKCSEPRSVATVLPPLAGHPEIVSFRCQSCGEVLTAVDEDGEQQPSSE